MFTGLPKYKATRPVEFWSTAVPAHWQVVPGISVIAENQARNTGLAESQVLSLSYGRVIVKPVEKQRGLVPDSYDGYQILESGDIVIRPTDLQNDQRSIRVGRVRDRGIITSAYIGLRSKHPWTSDYAYHYLAAVDSTKRIYGMGSGLRQQLGWPDLKRMPCLVPPLDEQAAIVKYLAHANARIDKAIAAKRRLLYLLDEQREGIQFAIVTGAGQPSQRQTASRWFPSLPSSWDVVPLGRVLKFAIDGPHFSPTYVDDGYPFLSARNIRADRWLLDDVKFVSKSDFEDFNRRVQPLVGDVLYTKGGTTGVARVVDLPFPFQVWVHVAVLRLRTSLVDPDYLALALNSRPCYEQSQLETRGATNQDLGLGRMKRIELPLPPLGEQAALVKEYAARTGEIARLADRARREIELLHEFRTRLAADVVTGQLDVREIAKSLAEIDLDVPASDQPSESVNSATDDVMAMSEV